MGEETRRADRVVVVLGDHEWEIENATVEVSKHGVVNIWYDEDGDRRLVATTSVDRCFVEWESLDALQGAVMEEVPDA